MPDKESRIRFMSQNILLFFVGAVIWAFWVRFSGIFGWFISTVGIFFLPAYVIYMYCKRIIEHNNGKLTLYSYFSILSPIFITWIVLGFIMGMGGSSVFNFSSLPGPWELLKELMGLPLRLAGDKISTVFILSALILMSIGIFNSVLTIDNRKKH
ncbi:hypothetical protein [Dethiobacter alkaliphilus]|uniref:Uncharacterized protein n=1 Tax=Dethiobacter alkaliphilus AHT 1 TaxID=555088 RepID=C0GD86_DETAL|nr:hypothetical protein [Dethiobacter alkaliphilus]EEG78607.1 hypothetical protein DealDRAFT_0537 [Dethiobacter alkaliphilus AHT 1]